MDQGEEHGRAREESYGGSHSHVEGSVCGVRMKVGVRKRYGWLFPFDG